MPLWKHLWKPGTDAFLAMLIMKKGWFKFMGFRKQPVSDYIKVERSREARHWISDVIIPIVGVSMWIKIADPELAKRVSDVRSRLFKKGKDLANKVFKPNTEEEAED